jgi:hypothetical protein
MPRAEDYRRHAAECVRLAQLTTKPEDKSLLLRMAEKWRELAERADRQSGESGG